MTLSQAVVKLLELESDIVMLRARVSTLEGMLMSHSSMAVVSPPDWPNGGYICDGMAEATSS